MSNLLDQSFEEVLKQYDNMIHYHIHKLHINDPEQEFYQEGCITLWEAYQTHDPSRGTFRQLANYKIHHRFIDLIRKHSKAAENEKNYVDQHATVEDNSTYDYPEDCYFWNAIQDELTEKQWKWMKYYIIEGFSYAEIAKKENTTIDAVKNWGREAKKKLKWLVVIE
ncbi:sigma-70 family RNA polymerase sigma factor [Thalassobacillus devorans]|uniref:sigma-70 family RNA polymerase sigma factor n=1 Tax=Thalassobacillus devorans TaxID=279813 RepID=UPI000A1C9630|nr:sigma-70 family RNA polymerase sigma factor [Thalassobacillus devorans]